MKNKENVRTIYIFQTRENNKMDELLDRIHQLESNEAIILKESNELREQNELLEFRIIELEESSTDKVTFNSIKYDFNSANEFFRIDTSLIYMNMSPIGRRLSYPILTCITDVFKPNRQFPKTKAMSKLKMVTALLFICGTAWKLSTASALFPSLSLFLAFFIIPA